MSKVQSKTYQKESARRYIFQGFEAGGRKGEASGVPTMYVLRQMRNQGRNEKLLQENYTYAVL